jgi:4-amino-4-deoxy-L-arabinose transferase-like glycosyltransferase
MSRRLKITLLTGIIAVGFLLRAAGLFWGEGYHFSGLTDELLSYRVALGLDAGEERAFYIGQPNFKSGKLPGPLWALFWLIGLKIGGSAEAVCAMMIVLNTVTIYLVYRLAENLLGSAYSLWAALFFATSPWAVHYSVGSWNPLPMAFFGALLYLALWDAVTRPNSPNIFWVCLLLAIMPHFHMMVVFVAPVVVLILWLSRARLNWRWLVAGALASVLLYVPYILGEARHNWENTRKILTGNTEPSFAVLKIFTLPIANLSNLMNSTTVHEFSAYRALGDACFGSFWILAAFNALSLALSVVIVSSFLVRLVQSLRGNWLSPRRAFAAVPSDVFIGLLLILPLLLFVSSFSNFNSRYLIGQFPLLFLLPAMFIVRGLSGPDTQCRGWRKPVRAMIVLTIVFNVIFSLAYFRYQHERLARADYFLPSFRKMESVRCQLKADAGPDCRIRIDDAPFLKSMPTKYTEEGIISLADYIGLREQYDPLVSRTQKVKTYQVRAAADKVDTNERAVYATNGVVFVLSK